MSVIDDLYRSADRRPAHTFLLHEGRRVSYAEFDALTSRLANALLAQGVKSGDRITLALTGNSIEFVVAAMGVLKAGATLNPLNPALGASQLEYILDHAGPRWLITDAAGSAALAPVLARLASPPRLASFGPLPGAVDLTQASARSSSQRPALAAAEGSGATLLYTSGTTGNPKGVLQRHAAQREAPDPFIEVLGINQDDVVLAVTPLFHGNAFGAVQTAMRAGATAVFPREFHGSQFWQLVHDSGATVVFTLGTILAMLLAREPSPLERTSRLRLILGLGSAPIRDRIIERFGVQDVPECYGSTDAGVVTLTPPGVTPRPGSAGKAAPGVDIRILDDAGQPLPAGSVGEIAVRRPKPLPEYFRDPELTRAAYRGEYFLTGDLGRLDADGWLYFVDRKKDFIRRGGENVSSQWVEKALREHPAVVEAAVIGVPHPVLGQEVKAYVVASAPLDASELAAFARTRLAPFEVPAHWEFRESLPKTPTQRIEKYKLREQAGGLGEKLLG
jgi:acyl-CoA synthetase (AMP-forming)/AMP-acid ligase II